MIRIQSLFISWLWFPLCWPPIQVAPPTERLDALSNSRLRCYQPQSNGKRISIPIHSLKACELIFIDLLGSVSILDPNTLARHMEYAICHTWLTCATLIQFVLLTVSCEALSCVLYLMLGFLWTESQNWV